MRQGCLASHLLFSLFVEFAVADVKSLGNEFKLDTNLSFDIIYAGDTTSKAKQRLGSNTDYNRMDKILLSLYIKTVFGERSRIHMRGDQVGRRVHNNLSHFDHHRLTCMRPRHVLVL